MCINWSTNQFGFPRPRGDGPALLRHYAARGSVSPPTRGPTSNISCALGGSVSPPTRGWTSQSPGNSTRRKGFPAHAGMDPTTNAARVSDCRFPRPRGDGPWSPWCSRIPPAVSPPTRGWTVLDGRDSAQALGFPAHAGMDPRPCRCCPGSTGFPRPRGDGPYLLASVDDTFQVSPPTRGWTRSDIIQPCRLGGFPAHAGMDLEAQPEAPVLPVFGGRGRDGARGVGGLLPAAV